MSLDLSLGAKPLALDAGQSAIVFHADGSVAYCVVPDESETAQTSRAIHVAVALMLTDAAVLDGLIARSLFRHVSP